MRGSANFVPGIFMASYIAQSRTDLDFVLRDRRKYSPPMQRYTSLADLDYIYGGVGTQNYNWFQFHLERIADFLTQGQTLPAVVAKLQTEFPAGNMKQEALEDLNSKLSRIRPGFLDIAGPLAGPATIAINDSVACQETNPGTERTTIAVRNRTSEPIVLTFFDGATQTIQPQAWIRAGVRVGASVKLPDGRCIVPRAEPTLTVIERK